MKKLLLLLLLAMTVLLCACHAQTEPEDTSREEPSASAEDPTHQEPDESAGDVDPDIAPETELMRELGFDFDFPELWTDRVTVQRNGQVVTVALDGVETFRFISAPNGAGVRETAALWEKEGYQFFGETPGHVVYLQILQEIPQELSLGAGGPFSIISQTEYDIRAVVSMDRTARNFTVTRDPYLNLWIQPRENELSLHRFGLKLALPDGWRDNCVIKVSKDALQVMPRAALTPEEDMEALTTAAVSIRMVPEGEEPSFDMSGYVLLGSGPAGSYYVNDRTGEYQPETLEKYPFMKTTAELIENGITLLNE